MSRFDWGGDATGPVDVDGRTLTQDNVVDELLHRPYLEIADPVAQDDVLGFRRLAGVDVDRIAHEARDERCDRDRVPWHAITTSA